jgi:hypothetical protein
MLTQFTNSGQYAVVAGAISFALAVIIDRHLF